MKPHHIAKLKNIDFEKVANALMNETHQGQVHLDICEGLTKVDPFILNHSPVAWQYTIWGHMYCAMMCTRSSSSIRTEMPTLFLNSWRWRK
jgi:hypothetical protein